MQPLGMGSWLPKKIYRRPRQTLGKAPSLVPAVFAAWLLLRVLRRPVLLDTLREFIAFLCISAGVAPALSALTAAPARHALGDATVTAAYHWFLGNALAHCRAVAGDYTPGSRRRRASGNTKQHEGE